MYSQSVSTKTFRRTIVEPAASNPQLESLSRTYLLKVFCCSKFYRSIKLRVIVIFWKWHGHVTY